MADLRISPATQTLKPIQDTGSYKNTRNRALEVMHESADSCTKYSTLYSGLSHDRLQNMRDASSTEEGQKKFEGKLLMVLTAFLGGAGVVSAAINPTGVNTQLLQTVKGVSETASKTLQPLTTATDTLCKGHQEPTQTRKSVAQSGTQEAHTIEGEMDQRVRTMQSNAQQVAQSSEIRV